MIATDTDAPDRELLSVIDAVDQLEDALSHARRLPLSTSVVVNEDEALELVDRIRLALPEELVQARHLQQDRERILGAADDEAERVLARAEQQAQQLLADAGERAAAMLAQHRLTEQARAHAETLVAESEARAATVRAEADGYVRDVMANLEEQLMRALATVRRGMETLPGAPAAPRRAQRGR